MQLMDERERGEEEGWTFLTGLLEIGVFLSESLVTYIGLLVIPLPEPEGS